MTIKDFQIIRKVLPWQSTTCQMPGPVEFITPEAGFAGNTPGANQLFEIADGENVAKSVLPLEYRKDYAAYL